MTSLAQLQHGLAQHLLGGHSDFSAAVRPGGIGTVRRLAIYHHAYRMRLLDALRDSFGHTLLYLGDDAFNTAALAYIEAHPSTRASLRWYGGDFAAWLPQQLPDEPETGELAALDRALRHAFDGPDATPLTLADLAAVPPEAWARVTLRLHPTFHRLTLRFNTLALWQAVDQAHDAPAAMLLAEPGELLVWRRAHQPHFRSLGAVEAAALAHMHKGLSFADTCAALAASFPAHDTATESGALLRRWVDEELLCGVA